MKYKNIYLLLLVPCALCLVTCSNKEQSSKKIFHYNESTGIASLDPAFSKNNLLCGRCINCSIHWLKMTVTPKQGFACQKLGYFYRQIEYIFHLRTDVTFHDNDAFEIEKEEKCSHQMWNIVLKEF
jgi:peptide/nickel transport system substrate-binding protein